MHFCDVQVGNVSVIIQRQKDRLVTEKHELLGWDPDRDDFEAEEVILGICNIGKCRRGNFGQLVTVLVKSSFLFQT